LYFVVATIFMVN